MKKFLNDKFDAESFFGTKSTHSGSFKSSSTSSLSHNNIPQEHDISKPKVHDGLQDSNNSAYDIYCPMCGSSDLNGVRYRSLILGQNTVMTCRHCSFRFTVNDFLKRKIPDLSNEEFEDYYHENETYKQKRAEIFSDTPETPANEFEISIISNNECIIKSYLGIRSVVRVPDTIQGKKVVALGSHSFSMLKENTSLEAVVIPDTVKKIGMCAFKNCTNLRLVYASKNIQQIGQQAFHNCESLETVDFGCGYCKPHQLRLPPQLESVGRKAFIITSFIREECIFKKIYLSRNTKISNLINDETFPSNQCSLLYY